MGKRSYPRAQLRAELRHWSADRRRQLVTVMGVSVPFVVTFVVLAALVDRPVARTLYLVLAVAAPLAFAAAIVVLFFVTSPRALHLLRGAWGEDNTRDELKRLRRRHTWGHLDSIGTQHGDVDHLVFLRRGGVVAIDSKWRSAWTEEIQAHVVFTAGRSRNRARGLLATQIAKSSGRHRGAVEKIEVTALAVVWGPAQEELAEPQYIDGVHVVAGRQLRAWITARTGEPMDRELARELKGALAMWDARSRRLVDDAPARRGAFAPHS